MKQSERQKNSEVLVNSWNEWDTLEEVVIGTANNACFPPDEPVMKYDRSKNWGQGPRSKVCIEKANKQMENLVSVLEEQCDVKVRRPTDLDLQKKIQSPFFTSENQKAITCPRDVMITMGDCILEAPMCFRSRYFEFYAYRDIVCDYYKKDPAMTWIVAPKPRMWDFSYNASFWEKSEQEIYKENMNGDFKFSTNETEILFDAADIVRLGADIFVQHSITTNLKGIEWIKRTFPKINVHKVNFPNDIYPWHIDANFVPLRKDLLMLNPERQPTEDVIELFKNSDWDVFLAPEPNNLNIPEFSQCSKWLSLNILSVKPDLVIIEEDDKSLKNSLEEKGIEVIAIPFRDVYSFGGSFHCVSWDIRRNSEKKSYLQPLF